MFVPGKLFQPSVMFASKAGAYQSEAPFQLFDTWAPTGLTHKQTRLENLARDKRSRLLGAFLNYECKRF
jgi:hypothetical protein